VVKKLKGRQKKPKKPRASRVKGQDKDKATARIKTETVASPWNNGFDKVTRVIDTIAAMKKRHQIDERQFDAAERYREAHQATHGAIKSALNDSSNGGSAPGSKTPSPHMLKYAEWLREAKLECPENHVIVRAIAGEGRSIEEVTAVMYGRSKEGKCKDDDLRHVGRLLREALNKLANHWFGTDRRTKHAPFMAEQSGLENLTVRGEVPKAKATHASIDRAGKFNVSARKG